MFKTIKKLLGIETQDTSVVTDDQKLTEVVGDALPTNKDQKPTTPKQKVASAKVKTETLTVKANSVKTKTQDKPKRETRKSLEKMTKVQIDDLAKERFGVELDRRKTKTDMIEAFMAAQKKSK